MSYRFTTPENAYTNLGVIEAWNYTTFSAILVYATER